MSKLRISPFFKQCFVTAAVCFTTIAHGNTFGLPAILLPQLQKPGGDSNILITKEEGSWIASVPAVTLLIGSFMAPPIMGRLGRRVAHFVVIVALLLGWLAIVLANDLKIILLGRTIHGMSFGLMLPLRSVLIGEYTSPKNRGAFLTAMSFSQGFGILLIHFVGSLVAWHHAIFILSTFPIVSLLMTFFTPETPSWLADKGRYEKSREVFRWLRGDGEEEELEAMINTTSNRAKTSPISNCGDLVSLVRKKKFYKPIIIMWHCYMMTEFSGGALMSNYSATVIGLVAGPAVNPNFWMVALDIQRSISTFMAVFVVRKIRRRVMLISTGGLCAFSNLAIACYIYTRDHGILTYTASWIPLLLINLQFFSVAVGLLTLPYVIAGEIFPLEYRSIGGSISIVAIASGYFLVTKTFPTLVSTIGGHGTYALYGVWLLYNLTVVSFMLPETKGKTLQQIEEHFQGKTVHSEDVEEVRQPLNNTEHPIKYAYSESTNR